MTRPGPGHDRWADATGAHVLGALPEAEHGAFEAHAAGCDACREEIAALRVAAEALPESVPPLEPPAALKARVMAQVDREAAVLAAAEPAADRPRAAARRLRRAQRWLRPAAGALAAAAAAVVAVSVGGGDATETFPATLDRAQVAAGARGELRVRDDAATLVVSGLRAPERGRAYQVWVKRPGRPPAPTSALFVPRSDGSASTGVPAKLEEGDAILVTSEPRGGSRAPTRAPVLSAPLS